MAEAGNDGYQPENFEHWPNDAGFQVETDCPSPVELHVIGTIPYYCAGVLYRSGPAKYKVDLPDGRNFKLTHWFDGFNQVHRFQILPTLDGGMSVKYNSRFTVDSLLERVRNSGSLEGFSFGQKRDPCQSIFKKLMSVFVPVPSIKDMDASAVNIGVSFGLNMPGIRPLRQESEEPETKQNPDSISSLVTRTDANTYQIIDPVTLDPMGLTDQTSHHPDLKGPLCSAHPWKDPSTGDVYNFNLEFGPRIIYRVFCASASAQETTILATITDAPPVYMHSFLLTPRFVVLCFWGSHFAFYGLKSLYTRNIVDAIGPFDKSRPCIWYVIDRSGQRGVIAKYTSPPFFAFHTVNAFEETSTEDPEQVNIIADVVCYDDLSILKRFYYENLMSSSEKSLQYIGEKGSCARSYICRYRLAKIPILSSTTVDDSDEPFPHAEILWAASKSHSIELPNVNPRNKTQKHRYIYGITDRGQAPMSDGLAKFDCETQKSIFWSRRAQSPSEAIFVPDPEAREDEEDKGTILSVVLDGIREKSYLLVLDAADLTELGRAEIDSVVGFGFHGLHVPS